MKCELRFVEPSPHCDTVSSQAKIFTPAEYSLFKSVKVPHKFNPGGQLVV